MAVYYSPTGNPEVWEIKPNGYMTAEEWAVANPTSEEQAVSLDTLFALLRHTRNNRIFATDYLLMADYPIDDSTRSSVMAYRQALRDLPSQDGAPWDGGGSATPWPDMPGVLTSTKEVAATSAYLPPKR